MTKKLFRFFIYCFAYTTPVFAQIQTGNAYVEHLTVDNGISSNNVNCIFQDSRGFIWIGTSNGLNRYDGVQVLQLHHNEENPNSLPGNFICNITEDSQHRLWIGTNEGICSYLPLKNQFASYLHTAKDFDILNATRFYVMVAADGMIWAASNTHLSAIDPVKNTVSHFKIDVGNQLPQPRNFNIRTPFEDSKKRLWLPTSYGVKIFNRKDSSVQSFHFSENGISIPENAVICIKETPGKKIMAGTWGAGILIFNEDTRRFEKMSLAENAAYNSNEAYRNIVFDILSDGKEMYLATGNGVLVLPLAAVMPGNCNSFTQYIPGENNSKTISSNFINAVIKDRDHTMWIAAKGVDKIDPSKQQFHTQFIPAQQNSLLPVSGIIFSNNKMLLGADDAYFFAGNSLLSLGLKNKFAGKKHAPQVWDMAEGKNDFWLASNNGLIRLDKNGKLTGHYKYADGSANSIAGERIWKVYEDSKGLVWLSSIRRGLSLVDPVNGTVQNFFNAPDAASSLFNNFTSDFFEDREGNIWLGALDNKLFCYRRLTRTFEICTLQLANKKKLSGVILPFSQTAAGDIIVATEKGILSFSMKDKITTQLATHPDLQNIHLAIADRKNHYWLMTNTSLLQYDLSTKRFTRYTTADGLYTTENTDVLKLSPAGDIVLAGPGYITTFHNSETAARPATPPVLITKVLANGSDSLFDDSDTKLSYLSGIEFHFTAFSFTNAAQNKYQYRLLGASNQWSVPAYERSVSYARLPPGNYVFEVRSSNEAGGATAPVAKFAFTIKRPFYKTFWFYLLAAMLVAALIYAFYRYRLRKAVEVEKIRTRIATDLHDDIGATLSSISMYSESLKTQVKEKLPHLEPVLNKIGENSREMVTGMSDIVWAINPGNDTGHKLLQRMENYATDICAAKNIQLIFEADEKISQLHLPLEHRKNIYLVFKEAVNNAVKYSGATTIHVQLLLHKKLLLQLKDDGAGFDMARIKKGNGLDNMQLRAREIGALLQIITAPGRGTTVQLESMLQ
ncbi:MAG: two-component regulator propeller domain-containing protein [Ferruginibacter sp.]